MNKDTLILVYYINIKGLPTEDVEYYMERIAKAMEPDSSEHCTMYFIPVNEGETRIDCINPKLISEEEYKIHIDKLNDANEAFNKALKLIRPRDEREEKV